MSSSLNLRHQLLIDQTFEKFRAGGNTYLKYQKKKKSLQVAPPLDLLCQITQEVAVENFYSQVATRLCE